MLSLIASKRALDDDFFSIMDSNGNEFILEVNSGVVYIPRCTVINEIIIENVTKCYKDLPIKFSLNGTIYLGFYLHSNLVTRVSELVDCDSSRVDTTIIEDYRITRNRTMIYVTRNTNMRKIIMSLISKNWSSLNYVHSNHIIDGSDIIKIIHDYTEIEDNHGPRIVSDTIPADTIMPLRILLKLGL